MAHGAASENESESEDSVPYSTPFYTTKQFKGTYAAAA